jgi:acyl-CoA reductase-like NAD-dependent aldehyde dehydrogenase
MSPRLAVRKTYKLYVGGAFARSESGRHDPVLDHEGSHVANITRASRNRGQVLYRAAEALESRGAEFAQQAVDLRGAKPAAARDEVAAAVDVLVHYAGWTDKLHAVLGGVNPVAAPFLSFSTPEATGIVGVVAPEEPELLGLVGAIAPALAAGNAVVAICSERWPLAGLDLGEVLAVSDVPAGVVNLLAGRREELAAALGAHRDLNAIVDASGDAALAERLDVLAAETVKRVVRIPQGSDARQDSLRRLEALTELKTAWHPVGA